MSAQPMERDVDSPKIAAFRFPRRNTGYLQWRVRVGGRNSNILLIPRQPTAVPMPPQQDIATHSSLQAVPALFMEHRFHNIAGNNDRPLKFSLGITVSLADHARDLGNRLTTLKDNHPFAGLMNTVEDGQAPHLEIGCVNSCHMTSIHGRSCHVKRVEKNVKKTETEEAGPFSSLLPVNFP